MDSGGRCLFWHDDGSLISSLQEELRAHPEKGVLIPGLGEARKVRVAAKGHGKCGGIRVVYYFQVEDFIHFLSVYPKNEKADLSPKDKKVIIGIIQAIEEGKL